MRINGKPIQPPAAPANDVKPTSVQPKSDEGQRPSGAARKDVVQISDAGRARASGESTSPDRLAEVRQRILSGAYDSVEILGSVAQKILDRHDV
jgi:negative regulator of flagellin synthesis FlgM